METDFELEEMLFATNNTTAANLPEICPMLTKEDETMLYEIEFICCIIQLVICIFGTIGNMFSVFLFRKKELISFFNQLLSSLSVFDMLYLITMGIEAADKIGLHTVVHTFLFPFFLYPLSNIAFTGSIYMTMAIAIERYIAVHHPLDYNRAMNDVSGHKRRLARYLVPVNYEEGHGYFIDLTEFRTSPVYISWYLHWARLVVLGLLPFFVISFLNSKICISVRRRLVGRRRADENFSIVLMLIVIIFFICNLPFLLLNLHEVTVIKQIEHCSSTPLMGFPVWVVISGHFSTYQLILWRVLDTGVGMIYIIVVSAASFQLKDIMCRYVKCNTRTCMCPHVYQGDGKCSACGLPAELNQTHVENGHNGSLLRHISEDNTSKEYKPDRVQTDSVSTQDSTYRQDSARQSSVEIHDDGKVFFTTKLLLENEKFDMNIIRTLQVTEEVTV